jgi:GT2 family glycosyltransferase
MTSAPHVTIIVLNWNGKDDTLACLESLEQVAYPNFEVLVVDNDSSDDSVAAIRARFPHRPIIETGANLGYAGGNNVGLRWALEQRTDYALLLNNDTEVAPDFLCILVETVESDPTVGVAGPIIYYYDQPETIWSAGGRIDWPRGQFWMLGLGMHDNGKPDKGPQEVDFVTGCALLVRAKIVQEVGELDERFFMYYEEAEWCVRIAKAGYRIIHVPQARLWHKISPESQADSPLIHYYMTRNRLLFLKATGAGLRTWLYTLIADYLRTLISWSVHPKWRGKRPLTKAMRKGIVDFARRRFGLASDLT